MKIKLIFVLVCLIGCFAGVSSLSTYRFGLAAIDSTHSSQKTYCLIRGKADTVLKITKFDQVSTALIDSTGVYTFEIEKANVVSMGTESKGIEVLADNFVTVILETHYSSSLVATTNVQAVRGDDKSTCVAAAYIGERLSSKDRYAVISVVALQDDTFVEISKYDISTAPETVQIVNATIDRLQTFSYQILNEDITGHIIQSDKHVSAFSGNQGAKIGTGSTFEPLWIHLPRTEHLGYNHLVPPIPHRDDATGSLLRVIGVTGETEITITDGTTNDTLPAVDPGQFREKMLASADSTYSVTCSNPCFVVQYNLNKGSGTQDTDAFISPIPAFEFYTTSAYGVLLSEISQTYTVKKLSIISEVGADLKLDGSSLVSSMVPANSQYQFASFDLTTAIYEITSDKPFMAWQRGHSTNRAYSFVLGINVIDCDDANCNNGECVATFNNFTCNCREGYTGDVCDVVADACSPNPCAYNGTCVESPPSYKCLCPSGFTGPNCLNDFNECASDPCQNEATCVNGLDKFNCVCAPGFVGLACETETDECSSNPCTHGGTCRELVNGYRCTCTPGWTGLLCDIDFDECASGPCSVNATCVNSIDTYHCVCQQGHTGDLCDKEIDECENNPCQNGGSCEDRLNGFHCECPDPYSGPTCEGGSDSCFGVTCSGNGKCLPSSDGYVCICDSGYVGTECESVLGTTDQCVGVNCSGNGKCLSSGDGYVCICDSGYVGTDCQSDFGVCFRQPCKNGGRCIDSIDGVSYTCICKGSWQGVTCEEDVDECLEVPSVCEQTCTNTLGSYNCTCNAGFIIAADQMSCTEKQIFTVQVGMSSDYSTPLGDSSSADFNELSKSVMNTVPDSPPYSSSNVLFKPGSIIAVITLGYDSQVSIGNQSMIAETIRVNSLPGIPFYGNMLPVSNVDYMDNDNGILLDVGDACFLYNQLSTCGTGQCFQVENSPFCSCPTGYTGEFCTEEIEEDTMTLTYMAYISLTLAIGCAAFVLSLVCYVRSLRNELEQLKYMQTMNSGYTPFVYQMPTRVNYPLYFPMNRDIQSLYRRTAPDSRLQRNSYIWKSYGLNQN